MEREKLEKAKREAKEKAERLAKEEAERKRNAEEKAKRDAEKEAVWERLVENVSNYAAYRERTDRNIKVYRLQPVEEAAG